MREPSIEEIHPTGLYVVHGPGDTDLSDVQKILDYRTSLLDVLNGQVDVRFSDPVDKNGILRSSILIRRIYGFHGRFKLFEQRRQMAHLYIIAGAFYRATAGMPQDEDKL